jgi:hypothetical protein
MPHFPHAFNTLYMADVLLGQLDDWANENTTHAQSTAGVKQGNMTWSLL